MSDIKEILIPIKQGERLSKALNNAGYPNIPTNVILNKTLTGIGATYMEIEAPRNSIIIEPNVPVIVGKVKDHKGTLGIYKGGATDKKIKSYLQNDLITYKKIITTPESYFRIKKIAEELNIDIFNNYFCLFDECEKISQDIEYREKIIYPIDDFFKFNEKAFVSATPKIINHEEIKKDFTQLKISPQFDYKIPINIIATNKINNTIKNYFDTLIDSKCICVFYNTVTGINKLINLLSLSPQDYAVFCSEKSVEKLSISGVTAIDKFDSSLMRKYNFFTCRYFSAVDMFTAYVPDIIMITNIDVAEHSMIDPESEAIQIQGRFRKIHPNNQRFNSICHISDFRGFDYLTDDEVLAEFEEWKTTFLHLQSRYNKATKQNIKRAIEKDFSSSRLYDYLLIKSLKETPRINYFSVVNKYMTERIKACYTSEHNLIKAYQDTNFYIPELIDEIDRTLSINPTNDIVIKLKNPTLPDKERIKYIIHQLDELTNPKELLNYFRDSQSTTLFKFTEDVIKAYYIFGSDYFQTKTIKTIRKDLLTHESLKLSAIRRESKEFYQAIVDRFSDKMQVSISKSESKAYLNEVFSQFNILGKTGKTFSATNKTIQDFFDVTEDNRAGINAVRLNYILPTVKEKILE